jgi:hypothetical protein
VKVGASSRVRLQLAMAVYAVQYMVVLILLTSSPMPLRFVLDFVAAPKHRRILARRRA